MDEARKKAIREGDDNVILCTRLDEYEHDHFDDNKYGPCDGCGAQLRWRPHNPPGLHFCFECFAELLEGQPSQEIHVSEQTLEEAGRWIATTKKKG